VDIFVVVLEERIEEWYCVVMMVVAVVMKMVDMVRITFKMVSCVRRGGGGDGLQMRYGHVCQDFCSLSPDN